MRRLATSGWFFVTWLFCLTLLPFVIILGMSFLTQGDQGIDLLPTLDNYARCFQWLYAKVLWKTLGLALTATVACLCVGFPVAYYLARTEGAWRTCALILLFIPFWTNFILRIYGIISLFGNNGFINQFLLFMNISDHPVKILYTRLGVLIGLIYNYLPFLVVPIFSALEKLDHSLREAAADLGAGRIQTFWKVVLPNIKEGVFVGSLFVFIPMLGEYVIPDLLGGAKEVFLGNIMVSQFFVLQDWPFGSALAGLLSIILLFALWLQNRWNRKLRGEKVLA